MGIPEEDLGPRWLRDYGGGFGDIAADIQAMEEFAAKLSAEVRDNYLTHLPQVTEAMLTRLPSPMEGFDELLRFMRAHRDAQDATQENVYNYGSGTHGIANAARTISQQYRGADAFARARVADVNRAFDQTATVEPAGNDPTGYEFTGDH